MMRSPVIPLPDRGDAAVVADWLALHLLTPPDTARIATARSIGGQVALDAVGRLLADETASDRLRALLARGPVDTVATALQRRHTALFEGIFRRRSLPPYASLWDGTGRLYGPAAGRMQAILRQMDVHLPPALHEAPDHLAIQLAALAEALRQDRSDLIAALTAELQWVARFAQALIQTDGDGFYGTLARLLTAFVQMLTNGRHAPAPAARSVAQ